jgi:hypothetical protein
MAADPMEVLLMVVAVLDSLQIPYLVGGSFASSIHGAARSTLDADLVALITMDQGKQVCWCAGGRILCGCRSHRKLRWYRLGNEVSDQQWRDLLTVTKVQRARLDLAYLRRWAVELGVADLLVRALEAAGIREQPESAD